LLHGKELLGQISIIHPGTDKVIAVSTTTLVDDIDDSRRGSYDDGRQPASGARGGSSSTSRNGSRRQSLQRSLTARRLSHHRDSATDMLRLVLEEVQQDFNFSQRSLSFFPSSFTSQSK
jgi:hypothetical protein